MAFYGFDVNLPSTFENVAVRSGHLALVQLPLVFILAGKKNIIGCLTGSSYERLNWIHRWISRVMFIAATIHFGYFMRSWMRYDYVARKLEIDQISRTGLGSWCVLLWLLVSSFSPIRGLRYEVFVVQHLISWVGFLVVLGYHIPEKYKVYIWISISLYAFDRLLRLGMTAYYNLSIFQRSKPSSGLLTCEASFERLPSRATRVSIDNPPFSWKAGQHAMLSFHSFLPFQSHPFTITSLPSDGKLEFIIQARTGGTDKIYCQCNDALPPIRKKKVVIDGPYGRIRPLQQFDSVIFIAGSSGASFTVPLLRELVALAKTGGSTGLVTKRIRFILAVKNKGQLDWFEKELAEALGQPLENLIIEASIYVTCDPGYTQQIETERKIGDDSSNSEASDDAACGGESGCCCRATIEDEDAIEATDGAGCCCCAPTNESKLPPKRSLSLPDVAHIITGRPSIRTQLRHVLEKARGETAVVACGPRGLVTQVRNDVVYLSDERAVHKGTGAQGIFLHTESFSW